ncbi:MAG: S8 family serine peptidase [Elusimicrobia bacterium]|nr:S8 family serine peptidase [Elusimicrobiota bacterium]
MKLSAPLAAALGTLVLASLAGAQVTVSTPAVAGSTPIAAPAPAPFKVEKGLGEALTKDGFSVRPDGSIEHKASGAVYPPRVLMQLGLIWDPAGRLVDPRIMEPVSTEDLMPLLKGMLGFSEVARYKPDEIGKKLQEWGVPQSYDNIHLFNPDGTATYFGLMLYHGLTQGPGGKAVDAKSLSERLSGERLSQSLSLFDSGYAQAFRSRRPDVGMADIKAGLGLLSGDARGKGETALEFRPTRNIADQLQDHQNALLVSAAKAADRAEVARIAEAAQALEALKRYRYHTGQSLDRLAPPGTVPPPDPMAEFGGDPVPPRHRTLPMVLSMMDSLPGPKMTPAQKEALIKSFPLGDTVWRMGAQDLWKEGLQGEGVKVAVIDTGVSPHPELQGVVKSRKTFTNQLPGDSIGVHATHVAGTIHALAPMAEIRSYAALNSDLPMNQTSRLNMQGTETEAAIMKAIDAAVADGNQVINMSLGGPGRPSDAMSKKINEYSEKGVIFIISSGNNGPFSGGVSAPSAAPQAWTAGALNAQGRLTSFTSFGRNFDPATNTFVVKPVFVAPGDNMNSTVSPMMGPESGFAYARQSGTSMAAPHVAGATVLMVDAVKKMNALLNPVEMTKRIQDAYVATGSEMPRREVAPEAPVEQRFIVVNPLAAYERLRDTVPQAVARPPVGVKPVFVAPPIALPPLVIPAPRRIEAPVKKPLPPAPPPPPAEDVDA